MILDWFRLLFRELQLYCQIMQHFGQTQSNGKSSFDGEYLMVSSSPLAIFLAAKIMALRPDGSICNVQLGSQL
jgi:hypothetical protein